MTWAHGHMLIRLPRIMFLKYVFALSTLTLNNFFPH